MKGLSDLGVRHICIQIPGFTLDSPAAKWKHLAPLLPLSKQESGTDCRGQAAHQCGALVGTGAVLCQAPNTMPVPRGTVTVLGTPVNSECL